jgi:hypothetical protein
MGKDSERNKRLLGSTVNRRNFLHALLGTAAATALPSEVWPFKKIFLPLAPTIVIPRNLTIASLQSVELEAFAKQIPDLVFRSRRIYELSKKRETVECRSGRFVVIDVNDRKGEIVLASVMP